MRYLRSLVRVYSVLTLVALWLLFAERAFAAVSPPNLPGLPPGWAGTVIVTLTAALWAVKKAPQWRDSWLHSTWWHVTSSVATAVIPVVIGAIQASGLSANAIVTALLGFALAYMAQDNPSITVQKKSPPPTPADKEVTSPGPKAA